MHRMRSATVWGDHRPARGTRGMRCGPVRSQVRHGGVQRRARLDTDHGDHRVGARVAACVTGRGKRRIRNWHRRWRVSLRNRRRYRWRCVVTTQCEPTANTTSNEQRCKQPRPPRARRWEWFVSEHVFEIRRPLICGKCRFDGRMMRARRRRWRCIRITANARHLPRNAGRYSICTGRYSRQRIARVSRR